MIPHRLPLPNITTDRRFLPLNGRRLGHSLSVTKFRKVTALTFPAYIPMSIMPSVQIIGMAVIRGPQFCMDFFNHCSFPNKAASIISRNPFVLSTK